MIILKNVNLEPSSDDYNEEVSFMDKVTTLGSKIKGILENIKNKKIN